MLLRHSAVPYWSGSGGVTPRSATPVHHELVFNNGGTVGADACASAGDVWFPDLVTRRVIWGAGILVKF